MYGWNPFQYFQQAQQQQQQPSMTFGPETYTQLPNFAQSFASILQQWLQRAQQSQPQASDYAPPSFHQFSGTPAPTSLPSSIPQNDPGFSGNYGFGTPMAPGPVAGLPSLNPSPSPSYTPQMVQPQRSSWF